MWRRVRQKSTTTMTRANVNVVKFRHALLRGTTTNILASVLANHTSVIQVSTLTMRAVAVSATSTRPAMTINTSTTPPASVCATI